MKRFAFLVLVSACASTAPERTSTSSAALDTVASFGSNPAGLTMLRYVPQAMPQRAPLVVALHGCTQPATTFATTGLDELADRFKFYVVYAQQNSANNPVSCFDWWGAYNNPVDKTNITRGQGENLSIKQMVDKMKADYSIDASRVFVIGFSSGGAMATVMLAAWPDVFAAGAIDAGVAYDCPSTTNSDVWQCMSPGKTLAASDWGTRVKNAYPGYTGAYPRVTIWQGTQDTTVATANQGELIKQWTNVHGISATPTQTDMIDGYPRQTFASNGVVKVESWAITGMPHGFAIDPSHSCGTASQYLIDKQICSARHMIDFFGITTAPIDDAGTDAIASDAAGDAAIEGGADASTMHDASATTDSGAHSDASGTHDSGGSDGGGASVSSDAGDASQGSGFAGCSVSRAPRPGSALLALIVTAFLARRARRLRRES
jgi:poly(hydroxyalkanoate) depolymerase family esterase